MSVLNLGSGMDDNTRRRHLYGGELFAFSPRPSSVALADFARTMIEDAFAPLTPVEAQHSLAVERFVEIVAPLKPRFIHHPETKRLIKAVLVDVGCDMDDTYFDVPRMRASTSDGYLSYGVSYDLHPHRDTWYSAPLCQLNWWMPVFDFVAESSMAFYPRYWSRGVANGSADFNYYEWNAEGRKNSAQHITSDTRKQPKPQEPLDLDHDLRGVCPPGGLILFSGAQLHGTVPNTSGRTRFSIDFRTVSYSDLVAGRGAPNLDSFPRGTSLRDFMRGSDLARLPEAVVARYDNESPEGGVLVFQPEGAEGGVLVFQPEGAEI